MSDSNYKEAKKAARKAKTARKVANRKDADVWEILHGDKAQKEGAKTKVELDSLLQDARKDLKECDEWSLRLKRKVEYYRGWRVHCGVYPESDYHDDATDGGNVDVSVAAAGIGVGVQKTTTESGESACKKKRASP